MKNHILSKVCLLLTVVVLFVYLFISSNRIFDVEVTGTGTSPILGEFMFFLLFGGIALLGLLVRVAYLNIKWLWPIILLIEILISWLCGLGIACWAYLSNDMYIAIWLVAPIFSIPSYLASLVIYYILILIIKNKVQLNLRGDFLKKRSKRRYKLSWR